MYEQIRTIYLAGPMSNKPYFNFPAFQVATEILRGRGHTVFSPAEADLERGGEFWKKCPNGTKEELKASNAPQINYRDCMRIDLNWILDHADTIALLPGWDNSPGAKAEKALADCLGLEVMYL